MNEGFCDLFELSFERTTWSVSINLLLASQVLSKKNCSMLVRKMLNSHERHTMPYPDVIVPRRVQAHKQAVILL